MPAIVGYDLARAREKTARSRRIHSMLCLALAIAMAWGAHGCSELPPNQLKWESTRGLPTRRASLTGVVAFAADRVIVVGYDRPENYTTNLPLAFMRTPAGWSVVQLPDPVVGGGAELSVDLYGVTRSDDGVAWACGRAFYEVGKEIHVTPLVYRFAGGGWSQFPIPLEGMEGVELHAIAARGGGAELELRAVGMISNGERGVALRYANGQWSNDSLPDASGHPTSGILLTVAAGPDGKWCAAGGLSSGGASFYLDEGAGWRSVPLPPGYSTFEFKSVAFDPTGGLWAAGNYSIGSSFQGALLRHRSGGFVPVSITRKTPGYYKINAIAFDVEGHGWVAGGRAGNLPFLAGSSGAAWVESIAEAENDGRLATSPREARGPRPNVETPGAAELYAVSVVGAQVAYAVGFRTELDPKGFFESEAAILELVIKPLGEVDHVVRPDVRR